MKVNLNARVRASFTNAGIRAWKDYDGRYIPGHGEPPEEFVLWELMNFLGSRVMAGGPVLVVNNEIEILE